MLMLMLDEILAVDGLNNITLLSQHLIYPFIYLSIHPFIYLHVSIHHINGSMAGCQQPSVGYTVAYQSQDPEAQLEDLQ